MPTQIDTGPASSPSIALVEGTPRNDDIGRGAARRAAAWLAEQPEAVDVPADARFVPNGPPPGLTPSRHPIWRVPGLPPMARPLRLAKGWIEERTSGALLSVLGATGIVFVHVPKNAGSSVAEFLYGGLIGHHSMQFLDSVLPRSFVDNALSFAIMREPRSRLLSAFTYLKDMASSAADIRFRDTHLSDIDDFEDFVRRLECAPFRLAVMRWHHFREQCSFLADLSGRILVDAVFSMDRMDSVQGMMNAATLDNRVIGRSNVSITPPIGNVASEMIDRIYGEDIRLYELLTSSSIQILRSQKFFERHGRLS